MKTAPWPVGQKVVCCFDHFPSAVFEVFDRVPQEGGIYTISEICWAHEFATGRPSLSVRLAELPPIQAGHGSFSLWRFKLLHQDLPAPTQQIPPEGECSVISN